MLIEYIQAAMRHAEFEQMEDGRFFGTIPPWPGLWADGDTVEETRRTLQEVLEDCIIVSYRHNFEIPPIDGVDINIKAKSEEYAETNQTT